MSQKTQSQCNWMCCACTVDEPARVLECALKPLDALGLLWGRACSGLGEEVSLALGCVTSFHSENRRFRSARGGSREGGRAFEGAHGKDTDRGGGRSSHLPPPRERPTGGGVRSTSGADHRPAGGSPRTRGGGYKVTLVRQQPPSAPRVPQILLQENNLLVTFTTTGDWVMDESHVYVGDCGDIPLSGGCNPQFGQFPYSVDHVPPVQSYVYEIPLSTIDSCFCFIFKFIKQQLPLHWPRA